ncbi:MAG: aminotransferase class IV [Nitriliruptoraceae bacterium]
MSGPMVWVDGAVVPAAAARISALDRGFRGGEGVFTTLRADRARVLRLGAHLDRLTQDAQVLGLELDREELTTAVAATVAANRHLGASLAVRVTCSAGPVDLSHAFPASGPTRPTVVVTAQAVGSAVGSARGEPVPWHRPMAELKSTSYLPATLAQRRAVVAGATDALLCDDAGRVVEAASANLFVVLDGEVRTAPLDAGVLPGVTRTAVIEVLASLGRPVREQACTLPELAGAEEAWLTSSVRGIRALTHLGGDPIASGEPGPITEQVRTGYQALLAREQLPLPGVTP